MYTQIILLKFLEKMILYSIRTSRIRSYKKLDTRQSENLIEFPRNISFNSSENCRSLFSTVKRFQTYFGFVVVQFFELGHTIKSGCFRHLENVRAPTYVVAMIVFVDISMRIDSVSRSTNIF